MLAELGTPEAILNASTATLRAAGLGPETLAYLRAPDWKAVEEDLRWLSQPGWHLLTWADTAFPRLLREIPAPPVVLFVRGDPEVLGTPQIAIVGSRNPTPTGRETAHAFAATLARSGFTITSGLAYGIDAASHQGALAGGGTTIAVAGCGLDRVYPQRHRDLARRIVEAGAVVSEFPPGTPPLAANFPQRNRIVSGLSLGVLVVEAAQRSGSLITARLAAEQGREVLAIPGSIHNPLARGCHGLIRQGAKLVETVADILEELGAMAATLVDEPPPGETTAGLDEDYQRLLASLGYEPTPVDTLVERTGLTVEVVSSMLLTLELGGHVSTLPGGLYARRPSGQN